MESEAKRIFLEGKEKMKTPGMEEEAFSLISQAAETGLSEALYSLGLLYTYGKGINVNFEIAAQKFKQAADQGFGEAQYIYAECLQNGKGITQNKEEALKYYELAADSNHQTAQYKLSHLLYSSNKLLASLYFNLAVENWHPDARYEWAVAQIAKFGDDPVDEETAQTIINSIKYAADNDVIMAQFSLGRMFKDGIGTTPNAEQAIHYLELALKNGVEEAQEILNELKPPET